MVVNITPETVESTKRELFTALQSKNTLGYYLRIVYDVTLLRLTLCDTSFGILASAPDSVLTDPVDIDTVNGKQYIKLVITLEMERKRHITRIMDSHRPVVCHDTKFPHEIVFKAVRINQAVVAYLFSPGCPEGFSAEALELIDYLGQILAVELQKNAGFEVESGQKYEYFLQALENGYFSSDEFAERRLRQLKRNPQPYYYMLHFAFDESEGRRYTGSRYYEPLLNIFPCSLVGVTNGRLYALLPREQPRPLNDGESQSLLKFLQFNRMRCGISYRYSSLTMTRYAMEQAEAAAGRRIGEERICGYESEYLNHLFAQGKSQDWLQAQISPDLRLLCGYDEKHRTEFVQTLRAYIMCSRSAVKAAEALHIHKSTFFYRMNKISELLDADVFDGERLFEFQFSLCLTDYLNREFKAGAEPNAK